MQSILRALALVLTGLSVFHSPALAQGRCSNAPAYFEPAGNSDGQRYPLTQPLPMNPTVAKPFTRTMPLSRDVINFQ